MMLLTVQTGARLSEITGLKRQDVILGSGAHIHVVGKGRKERCTPLTKQSGAALTSWLLEPTRGNSEILFPNARGGHLSADGMQYILAKHTAIACQACPSLKRKHVTPHVLRHTTAMELLQAGVDTTVIALWLGHESVETTQVYLNANLALKEKILAKTTPHDGRAGSYRPSDQLLAFLNGL
jgi:site-specific recombinase XerD